MQGNELSTTLDPIDVENVRDIEPLRHIYPHMHPVAYCGHRRSELDPPRRPWTGKGRYCATCQEIWGQ